MKLARIATALLLCLFWARAGWASEASEALTSRGLIELHENHREQARDLFQQALQADPSDTDARYYHAVVCAELGDTDTAITDLRMVLAAKPNFNEAALELGTIFTENGWYSEGAHWLEQAQTDPRLDAKASFALGLAELRLQHPDSARQNFQRARERDPSLTLASRYYEGVADYRAGNNQRAADNFRFVKETSPDTAMGAQADAFLSLLRRGRIGNYSLYGSVSLSYDSNVIIAPDNQVVGSGISRQADGAVNINAGGIYVPWETDQFSFSLGYDFFQSLYFQLHDFNLEDHRPSAQFLWNPGPVQIGLVGRYDYYLLETSSLLEDITGLLWMSIPEEGFGTTEASFRGRDRNAYDKTYKPLDGFEYAGHIVQGIQLGSPARAFLVGLQGETNDTRNFRGCTQTDPFSCGAYSYNAIQMEAGLGWRFNPGLEAQIGYRYRNEDYDAGSEGFATKGTGQPGPRREDRENQALFSITQQLTDILWLNAAYMGTWNESNKVEFQYTRQIGLIGVEVRL